jgi:hypothetical protein
MIPHPGFAAARDKYLAPYGRVSFSGAWEPGWDKLQYRRLEVEKQGPEIKAASSKAMAAGVDLSFQPHAKDAALYQRFLAEKKTLYSALAGSSVKEPPHRFIRVLAASS